MKINHNEPDGKLDKQLEVQFDGVSDGVSPEAQLIIKIAQQRIILMAQCPFWLKARLQCFKKFDPILFYTK